MNTEDFDDIIKKYTQTLEMMGQTYGGEAEKVVETPPKTENEETLENEASYSPEEENAAPEAEIDETPTENEDVSAENENIDTEPAVNEPATESAQSEATSFASFTAVIFSGEGAYPVEGARVVVYRDDNIYAFLETDENGTTKKVRLPAFEMENSLESENPDQSIDYFADVFAEGFTSQKGLLVSSVGGSEILLRVLMVPEDERIG